MKLPWKACLHDSLHKSITSSRILVFDDSCLRSELAPQIYTQLKENEGSLKNCLTKASFPIIEV